MLFGGIAWWLLLTKGGFGGMGLVIYHDGSWGEDSSSWRRRLIEADSWDMRVRSESRALYSGFAMTGRDVVVDMAGC
jgi:hypothetical protein